MARSRHTLLPSKAITVWWVAALLLCVFALLIEQTVLLVVGVLILLPVGLIAARQRVQAIRTKLNRGVHPLDERDARSSKDAGGS